MRCQMVLLESNLSACNPAVVLKESSISEPLGVGTSRVPRLAFTTPTSNGGNFRILEYFL